jgi:hypothetical protein
MARESDGEVDLQGTAGKFRRRWERTRMTFDFVCTVKRMLFEPLIWLYDVI